MKKAVVCLANGFEEMEAIGIIDILRRAEIFVTIISITGVREVQGAHDIGVMADELFENVELSGYDMIVLPGGMPGSQNLKDHSGLRGIITDFNTKGKLLGAICAAPMVLGDLGILENKDATCYPGFSPYLKGAHMQTDRVVEDHNIITGIGPGAVFDFALKLVERLCGKEMAASVAGQMLYK
jgi:4-methyl-5(b-hydroxyethyl)-thiazole monophosphate biosynthesis